MKLPGNLELLVSFNACVQRLSQACYIKFNKYENNLLQSPVLKSINNSKTNTFISYFVICYRRWSIKYNSKTSCSVISNSKLVNLSQRTRTKVRIASNAQSEQVNPALQSGQLSQRDCLAIWQIKLIKPTGTSRSHVTVVDLENKQ